MNLKILKGNSGLKIGVLFTAFTLLISGTIIIPIIFILPGLLFDEIAKQCINNQPYSNVGKLTIYLLGFTFLFVFIACLFWVDNNTKKKKEISTGQIILFFLNYFFVQSLGFYIYWGVFLNFESDGQVIFSAAISSAFSCLLFIPMGFVIDLVKNVSSGKVHSSNA